MQFLFTDFLDQTIQLRVTWLGVPGLGPVVAEEFLNFFDGLAAGFGVSVYRIRMGMVRMLA